MSYAGDDPGPNWPFGIFAALAVVFLVATLFFGGAIG